MKRIGIFGGSFNPVHVGHIALAKHLLAQLSLAEVRFVVSPQNPLKRAEDLLPDDIRLALVRQALADDPQLVASDVEFALPRPSYMWHTLQQLTADEPANAFVLLIGADNWAHFNQWFRAEDILSHYAIAVYPREGYPLPRTAPLPHVQFIDAPLFPVSSTLIRQKARHGEPIDSLVPRAISAAVQQLYCHCK